MGCPLSHKLLNAGFFSALGTRETGRPEGTLIGKRTPMTYDANNGTVVIYDEHGWPWVILSEKLPCPIGNLEKYFSVVFVRGAFVPHSNDGGHFMCEVLPELMK
jgi:hypothetical protein